MKVKDVMSTPVFTIRDDKRLKAVEEIMGWAHMRHVPVVDAAGKMVGIISHRDLMGAAVSTLAIRITEVERRQHLAAGDVRSLMRTDVATIGPDATVQEAARLLREKKIGCLPVVDGDKLLGIITAVDLLGVLERIETVVTAAA